MGGAKGKQFVGFAATFGGAEFDEGCFRLPVFGELDGEEFACVRVVGEAERGAVFANRDGAFAEQTRFSGARQMRVESVIVAVKIDCAGGEQRECVEKRQRILLAPERCADSFRGLIVGLPVSVVRDWCGRCGMVGLSVCNFCEGR